MKLAVVIVHYHAAELAAAACEALAGDLRSAGRDAEQILVDNGSRPEEKAKLRALPVRLLEPAANLGYAGGANLAVQATDAEHVVVMNPDVVVLPGCIAALCAALEQGAAAAGPRFFWDRKRRFLLPPTERRTRRDELLRVLGERGEPWARRGRQCWRRHARRCWTAREPYPCYELSGALLAFRRRAWDELGGFDEGYRLYFEETDWLERLRRRGREARFVPQAEAVHLYAQSTIGEPRAAGWFAESQRRFRRRFYGAAFTALLERLGRPRLSRPRLSRPRLSRPRLSRPRLSRPRLSRPQRAEKKAETEGASRSARAAWLEVSSSVLGYPAAARRLEDPSAPASLPEEIRARLPPGTYYLRTVEAAGRELGVRAVDQKRSPSPIV